MHSSETKNQHISLMLQQQAQKAKKQSWRKSENDTNLDYFSANQQQSLQAAMVAGGLLK